MAQPLGSESVNVGYPVAPGYPTGDAGGVPSDRMIGVQSGYPISGDPGFTKPSQGSGMPQQSPAESLASWNMTLTATCDVGAFNAELFREEVATAYNEDPVNNGDRIWAKNVTIINVQSAGPGQTTVEVKITPEPRMMNQGGGLITNVLGMIGRPMGMMLAMGNGMGMGMNQGMGMGMNQGMNQGMGMGMYQGMGMGMMNPGMGGMGGMGMMNQGMGMGGGGYYGRR